MNRNVHIILGRLESVVLCVTKVYRKWCTFSLSVSWWIFVCKASVISRLDSLLYVSSGFFFFGGTLNLFKEKIELGLDVTKANLLPGSPLTVCKALIPLNFWSFDILTLYILGAFHFRAELLYLLSWNVGTFSFLVRFF